MSVKQDAFKYAPYNSPTKLDCAQSSKRDPRKQTYEEEMHIEWIPSTDNVDWLRGLFHVWKWLISCFRSMDQPFYRCTECWRGIVYIIL
jgi:hypothetical protein